MPQLDEYLRAVEEGLHCPAERRPAIIEELGAHLRDRVEALVAQGEDEPDAQRQATREMGPAWLLALRLSAANGWTGAAHACRQIWAAGIGLQLAFVAIGNPLAVGRIQWHERGGRLTGIDAWVFAWGPYLLVALLLTAFPVFAFALARWLRGWLWAAVPGMGAFVYGLSEGVVSNQPWSLTHPGLGAIMFFAAGAAFVAAAVQGSRKESPRLTGIAWASAALLVGCSMAWCFALPRHGLADVFPALRAIVAMPVEILRGTAHISLLELAFGAFVLMLPWLFWGAAWVIDRQARGRLTGSAA
jgi:hypothetical protein